MPTRLLHQCLMTIPENIFNELLDDTNTINSFCSKIERLSNKTTLDPNVFKGDVLELFTEYLIKTRGSDNRIGINEYKLIQESKQQDLGVDGYGIGANLKPATVQVKYRHHDYELSNNEDHLSNFLVQSWTAFKVDMTDTMNMLIITTAQDVHYHTMNNMLQGKVRVLHRNHLKSLVDNDDYFWTDFYNSIKESISIPVVKPQKMVLRPHQQEAITAIIKDHNGKGQVILPTGTGKTVIEAETIAQHILQSSQPQTIKVYASRILLCFQLIKEIQDYLLASNIDVDLINFNSGNLQDTEYIKRYVENGFAGRKVESTTSNLELKNVVMKSHANNKSIIIFSTYHSGVNSHRDDLPINLSIFDEAHNTVNEEFRDVVDLPSEKTFFFTATQKFTDSDTGFGMNNEIRYDDIIFQKTPYEMIEAGEICRPYIHIVKTDIQRPGGLNDAPDAIVHSIFSAFFEHEAIIKQQSYNPDELGAKIIVAVEGQNILKAIMKSDEMNDYRRNHPHIHIGAISSEYGIFYDGVHNDGAVTNMAKHEFLQQIKALKNNDSCIIFHVDMIGEGIDIPGITGVMPFRNQNVIKFVQFLGRSMRLHPMDKSRFYKGEINPNDVSKYIKPYAWVIIPDFLQNSPDFEDRYKQIVRNMKYHYGFKPSEMVLYGNKFGLNTGTNIQTVNQPNSGNIFTQVGMVNYEHELESLKDDDNITHRVIEITNQIKESGTDDFTPLVKYLESLT